MGELHRLRYALIAGLFAALLSGCGGASSPGITPNAAGNVVSQAKGSETFNYTGAEQKFVVPNGVTKVKVRAIGAAGAGVEGVGCGPLAAYDTGICYGRGGRVDAEIPVTPGEKLYVNVGGKGGSVAGGFNGGGNPGITASYDYGNGGGGASDIRAGGHSLKDRIIVAAGGGGEGFGQEYEMSVGGNGGGATGGNGSGEFGEGGSGGSQTQGGAGGAAGGSTGSASASGQPGGDGALGVGGSGGNGGVGAHYEGGSGGGGGAGYYGGGGGGGSGADRCCIAGAGGGGGGGSSYIEPTAIKFHTWTGWKDATGDGLIVVGWH
jgi:hypothetical protein